MSNSNVIAEKKKALLAYKEKILDEIKYSEKRIDDFRANLKKNRFYEDHADSSESKDDFPSAIDLGPSITQLKQQQSMKKTCLHATQELTGLMVLQSEVDVLVEEPKFEGECPVTEAGTWREVTAECRIDLVPFTMTFFMHTPDRKFGPPSYRGLRVVPVKSSHELELSKSVLHSLKVPSDAVEVLRSYAAGYRSRRTTLARLANKYTNALFMEPHAEGGFVMKCADLLEVSWKLENKWSPVAPFHHKMKFDLEFMEESYIKIITQAHKELLDPALQTDERTLLLAKIITTCLEARGPIDPESDLESKTTERDNDIDIRDIENEKRDSEVMAPPKSLPKKGKQKKTGSLPNTAEKRKIDGENGDAGAKKMKNDVSEAKKSIAENNNPRKSNINDVVSESGKKRKMSEANKVVNSEIVEETDNIEDGNTKSKEIHKDDKTSNTKAKNAGPKKMKNDVSEAKKSIAENSNPRKSKINDVVSESGKKRKMGEANKVVSSEIVEETYNIEDGNTKSKEIHKEDKTSKTTAKNVRETDKNAKNLKEKDNNAENPIDMKESVTNKDKNINIKTKNKVCKEAGDTAAKETNPKPKTKVLKEPAKKESNSKPKTVKDTVKNHENGNNDKLKDENTKDTEQSKESATKKAVKKPANTEKIKNNVNKAKNTIMKETGKVKDTVQNQENGDNDKLKDNTKDTAQNKESATNKVVKEPANTEKVKNNVKKAKNTITTETGNVEENNHNGNKTKNKVKNVANMKSNENTDVNNDAGRPISKITGKNTNIEKNLLTNVTKVDSKPIQSDATKVKNLANAKNNDQTTKKGSEKNINVASAKNDDQSKKSNGKNDKNKEKVPEVANKGAQKNIKEKTVSNSVKNDAKIVKKATEKNATNVRNKDKISEIGTKVSEKIVKDKLAPIQNKPENVLSSNINTKNKNIIKKPIITKIASHRNSLKPQNPPKVLKPGNTKSHTTGNIEKENGGKGSKIPQKTSTISEGSSKKNFLRISPRVMPSKFKTQPQTLKQKMMKYTNIPMLLKKPAPKTT